MLFAYSLEPSTADGAAALLIVVVFLIGIVAARWGKPPAPRSGVCTRCGTGRACWRVECPNQIRDGGREK